MTALIVLAYGLACAILTVRGARWLYRRWSSLVDGASDTAPIRGELGDFPLERDDAPSPRHVRGKSPF